MKTARETKTRRELLVTGAGAAAAATLGGAALAATAARGASAPQGDSEAMHVYRLLSVELLILFTL